MNPIPAGIGLRHAHYREFRATRPPVGFIEVHSENYFGTGGRDQAVLLELRADYPVSLHGVGLSLGSATRLAANESSQPTDLLCARHLERLAALVERVEPRWVSEHLCWGAVDGQHLNELLPIPYTQEALATLVLRVAQVQERLRRPILVENISAYLEYAASEMTEMEFLAELASRTGCGILLDLNNAYVNAVNHGHDLDRLLAPIPLDRVGEIHLAGFTPGPHCLIDTHARAVAAPVWELYRHTIARAGPIATLIEWDADLPPLEQLVAEAAKADHIAGAAIATANEAAIV